MHKLFSILFDSEDFFTDDDIAKIKEAKAQVARGEVFTLKEVKSHLSQKGQK